MGGDILQMMGVFAEFERAMIRERVNAGLARAKAEGKALGRAGRKGLACVGKRITVDGITVKVLGGKLRTPDDSPKQLSCAGARDAEPIRGGQGSRAATER